MLLIIGSLPNESVYQSPELASDLLIDDGYPREKLQNGSSSHIEKECLLHQIQKIKFIIKIMFGDWILFIEISNIKTSITIQIKDEKL